MLEKLVQEGFYDGTIFHRIVKNFVIEGGDNNTKPNGTGRQLWGTRKPGFTLKAEFNGIPHKRGILRWHIQMMQIMLVHNIL